MKKNLSQRDINLDLIRSFAVWTVISVHFFYNSGFYYETVAGYRMYIMLIVRTFCMVCVPLFMILSGYLLNTKTLCRKYYFRIIPILTSYVLASVCCMIYKIIFCDNVFTFKTFILGVFNFSIAGYS